MNQNDQVSLGCGTLILIVLIVMIFGNMNSQNLEPQVRALKTSMQGLESKIEALDDKIDLQTESIEALRQELRKERPEAEQ